MFKPIIKFFTSETKGAYSIFDIEEIKIESYNVIIIRTRDGKEYREYFENSEKRNKAYKLLKKNYIFGI